MTDNDENNTTEELSTINTETTKNMSKGIDIREAFEILSSRASKGGDKSININNINEDQKRMGQTINLIDTQEWTRLSSNPNACDCSESTLQQDGVNTKITGNDSSSKTSEQDNPLIFQELSRQSTSELFATLFQLQQERVITFKKYDTGLDSVLRTGNLTEYPTLTSNVTATFSVISKSIKHISEIFQSRVITTSNNDERRTFLNSVTKLISELQAHEKEKLHLTAAIHLEKIRERNENANITEIENDNDQRKKEDGLYKISKLLQQSIQSLQSKIDDCVEKINDVLEELRYASTELEE